VGVPFDQSLPGFNGTMRPQEQLRLHALAPWRTNAPQRDGNGFHSAYVRDPDGNKLAFVYYASAA
jgi:hypothetical protein